MDKTLLLLSLSLLFAVLILQSRPVLGEVYWKADFEEGNFYDIEDAGYGYGGSIQLQWNGQSGSGYSFNGASVSMETGNPFRGSYSIKNQFNIPTVGTCRAQAVRWVPMNDITSAYYGMAIYIQPGFSVPYPGGWSLIAQLHEDGVYRGNGIMASLELWEGSGWTQGPRFRLVKHLGEGWQQLWLDDEPAPTGRWFTLVWYIENQADGILRMWIDGEYIGEWTGDYVSGSPSHPGPTISATLYGGGLPAEYLFYDEVIVASTLEEATPVRDSPTTKNRFYGKLTDSNSNPLEATISIGSYSNSTDTQGDYLVEVDPGTYDIRYDIPSFYFPNYFITMPSVGIQSDVPNLISSLTQYPSQNRLSFLVDNDLVKRIQAHSPEKPNNVIIDGTEISEVSSLSALTENTWYYDSASDELFVEIPTSSTPSGWLHTDGRWIKDDQDDTVYLHGFNTYIRLHNELEKFQSMKDAGADYVRIMFWKSEVEREGYVPTQWEIDNKIDKRGIPALDDAIAYCEQVGLKVILDHQLWTEGLDSAPADFLTNTALQDEWLDMWRLIVDRYADNSTVVGIDLMNEPYLINTPLGGAAAEAAWETIAKSAILDLETHNPDLLFIVEDFGDSYPWQDVEFLQDHNCVYSTHCYYHYRISWQNWAMSYAAGNLATGKQQYGNWIDSGVMSYANQGVPVWMGELGADSSDPYYLEQIEDALTLYDERGVGYSCYTYMAVPWTEPFDVIDRADPDAYVLTNVGQVFSDHFSSIP